MLYSIFQIYFFTAAIRWLKHLRRIYEKLWKQMNMFIGTAYYWRQRALHGWFALIPSLLIPLRLFASKYLLDDYSSYYGRMWPFPKVITMFFLSIAYVVFAWVYTKVSIDLVVFDPEEILNAQV